MGGKMPRFAKMWLQETIPATAMADRFMTRNEDLPRQGRSDLETALYPFFKTTLRRMDPVTMGFQMGWTMKDVRKTIGSVRAQRKRMMEEYLDPRTTSKRGQKLSIGIKARMRYEYELENAYVQAELWMAERGLVSKDVADEIVKSRIILNQQTRTPNPSQQKALKDLQGEIENTYRTLSP
jgi:hypothetical protein